MALAFRYYMLYKPFGVLSQFTSEGSRPGLETLESLKKFPRNVYPLGRLDADSEGLLLLSDDGKLNHQLLDPKYAHERTYCAQVEGVITDAALEELRTGIILSVDGKLYETQPAQAQRLIEEPTFPPRNPPIRFRANIPTSWLELKLIEGKNRQVRKMTAAVGFPTLRLVRTAIVDLQLGNLQPGACEQISRETLMSLLQL